MIGKNTFWGGSEKQWALELRWREAQDCSRGGYRPVETETYVCIMVHRGCEIVALNGPLWLKPERLARREAASSCNASRYIVFILTTRTIFMSVCWTSPHRVWRWSVFIPTQPNLRTSIINVGILRRLTIVWGSYILRCLFFIFLSDPIIWFNPTQPRGDAEFRKRGEGKLCAPVSVNTTHERLQLAV